jgi:hypothetical protein
MRLKTGGKSHAAYQKSRYGKEKGKFRGRAGVRHERRLILQQRALAEIDPMSAIVNVFSAS